jgi:hypothetical protein
MSTAKSKKTKSKQNSSVGRRNRQVDVAVLCFCTATYPSGGESATFIHRFESIVASEKSRGTAITTGGTIRSSPQRKDCNPAFGGTDPIVASKRKTRTAIPPLAGQINRRLNYHFPIYKLNNKLHSVLFKRRHFINRFCSSSSLSHILVLGIKQASNMSLI